MLRRQSALKSQVKEEQQANFVYKLIDGVVLAPTSATKVVKLAPAGVSKLLFIVVRTCWSSWCGCTRWLTRRM